MGSALYTNALDPAGENSSIVPRVDQIFDRDHLSPVLAAMLFPDATQRFYPWPVPAWDRALGLELSFSEAGSSAGLVGNMLAPISLEGPFYSDHRGTFLVLNTTEVDSGRRFLLSPFLFPSDATFHEPSRGPGEPQRRQDVRFSTAAVMSARFPLITPYAFFNGTDAQRQRRTVDGGYYDNAGAVPGSEISSALNTVLKEEQLTDRFKVILIAIVNRSSFLRLTEKDSQNSSDITKVRVTKPLLGISALDALFATREARVSKTLSDYGVGCGNRENDGLCITLWPKYQIDNVPEAARSVRNVPLGWSLSCQTRAFISSQLDLDPASALRSEAGGKQASMTNGPADLPCLRRQEQELLLKAVEQPSNFPTFAEIVKRARERVGQGAYPAEP